MSKMLSVFPLPVQIDILQPLETQGPFVAILHKLTDVLSLADDGDKKSKEMIDNLKVHTRVLPPISAAPISLCVSVSASVCFSVSL